jgi:hypothetical protein
MQQGKSKLAAAYTAGDKMARLARNIRSGLPLHSVGLPD